MNKRTVILLLALAVLSLTLLACLDPPDDSGDTLPPASTFRRGMEGRIDAAKATATAEAQR